MNFYCVFFLTASALNVIAKRLHARILTPNEESESERFVRGARKIESCPWARFEWVSERARASGRVNRTNPLHAHKYGGTFDCTSTNERESECCQFPVCTFTNILNDARALFYSLHPNKQNKYICMTYVWNVSYNNSSSSSSCRSVCFIINLEAIYSNGFWVLAIIAFVSLNVRFISVFIACTCTHSAFQLFEEFDSSNDSAGSLIDE